MRNSTKVRLINSLGTFIEGFFTFLIGIGGVWFWVWILNPGLTSNTVWLIAILYAAIQEKLYWIRKDINK